MQSNNRQTKPLIISNGNIIDPANNRLGKFDIIVNDGKISKITSELGQSPSSDAGLEAINAKGAYVVPGFVDLHTHLREPGFEYKEDIESGSRAAAAGGFTTIFCMPNTKPVDDNVEVTKDIKRRASDVSIVKIYPVSAISKNIAGRELVDLKGMQKEGIIAISDDGNSIQDRSLMKRGMELARELDLLVISHPEDKEADNSRDAENLMINRDIELAKETGARLHIAHVSTAEGIKMVSWAKRQGLKVTCEVTPHHLLLTEDSARYKNDSSSLHPNFIMNPPLRTDADREALISGLRDGTVDAIATDHAPHEKGSLGEGKDEKKVPPGVIGMETALPVCMKLVEDNQISLMRLIELLTIGPANVVALKCGRLTEGGAADITIFDTSEVFHIESSNFRSKSCNTPFNGWEVRGKILKTIVDGKIV